MSLDISLTDLRPVEVFEVNITHNLGVMANAAGLYKPMWQPEKYAIDNHIPVEELRARHLVNALEDGLDWLHTNEAEARGYEPENGWGTLENLREAAEGLLQACLQYPDATVSVWR